MTDPDVGPSTQDLLSRLPSLPAVNRPFLTEAQLHAPGVDADLLSELLSGTFFDYMLDELQATLPDVAAELTRLGPRGFVLKSAATNSINALTIPRSDGIVVLYNIGLYSLVFSTSLTIALTATAPDDAPEEAQRGADFFATMVDWASSLAREPRTTPLVASEDATGLAANVASRAQRFVFYHELGHALTFCRREAVDLRPEAVAEVRVPVLDVSWEREFQADREGLRLYLRVLRAQKQDPVGARIGVEVFLGTAAILEALVTGVPDTHPPARQRLDRLRTQFRADAGVGVLDAAGDEVGGRLDQLGGWVLQEVARRRAAVTSALEQEFAAYERVAGSLAPPQRELAARKVSRYLLESPGATLLFLRDTVFAPMGPREPATGSARRLLALNAALHFEKSLQDALQLSRIYTPAS